MAKAIKEMAYDHVVAYMHNDEYEEMQDTFEAGANAVLSEIENVIESICGKDPILTDNSPIRKISECIKELKGE